MRVESSSGNSGKNTGGIKNLRPWKKGQSGNPLGRPKKTLITDALQTMLAEVDPRDPLGRTNAEIIADRMITRAKQKDRGQQDAAEIADRTEGKSIQKVDVAAEFGATTMTMEQVTERIIELLTKARARAKAQIISSSAPVTAIVPHGPSRLER